MLFVEFVFLALVVLKQKFFVMKNGRTVSLYKIHLFSFEEGL